MTFKLVLTTANSIIGVSILAMPYCFKECGIVLALFLIISCAYLVRMCCHLLVKSAYLSHSRTYELLAFHTYGAAGKFAVEFCMIGFMMGTCVAFFVVVGDLLPPFFADALNLPDQQEAKDRLRLWVMIGMAIFFVLPLSMLRQLDSLSFICTASLIFYSCVTLFIMSTAKENIFHSDWSSNVQWWRPAGIFKCLPIFCMGLSCQPQVFEVRAELSRHSESTPPPSKMNRIVGNAVMICAATYIIVGIFGYVALSHTDLGGNVLTAYEPSMIIRVIKIGFGISVALSFPLVIFPCRTAIHSLLFPKPGYSAPLDMATANYITPNRSNGITLGIILITLIVGINTPDIEKVLGIVGSTIGNVVCILIPSVIFIKLTEKNTTERLGAKFVFVTGIMLMSLGTYVNLEQTTDAIVVKPVMVNPKPILAGDETPVKFAAPVVVENPAPPTKVPEVVNVVNKNPPVPAVVEKRIEPVEPHAPVEEEPAPKVEVKKEDDSKVREAELKVKEAKADKLLEELEKQKEEHKQIIEEQKEVLDQMKQHLEDDKEDGAKKVIEPQVNKDKSNQSGQGLAQQPVIAEKQEAVVRQEQSQLVQNKGPAEIAKSSYDQKVNAQHIPVNNVNEQQIQGQNYQQVPQNNPAIMQNGQNVLPQLKQDMPISINQGQNDFKQGQANQQFKQNNVIPPPQQVNQISMNEGQNLMQQRPAAPAQNGQVGQGQVHYNPVPSNPRPQFQGQNIMNQVDMSNDLQGAKQAVPETVKTNVKIQQQAPLVYQSNTNNLANPPLGYQPETNNRVEQKQVPLQGQQQPILDQAPVDAVKHNPVDTKKKKDKAQNDIVETNHEDRGVKKDFKRDIPAAPAQIGGRDLKMYLL